MEKIINAIFPPRCVFCGALGDVFCENCISNCSFMQEQRCLICDRPSDNGYTHQNHFLTPQFGNNPGNYENKLKDASTSEKDTFGTLNSRLTYPTQIVCPFIYEKNVRECIRLSKYSSRLFSCLKRLSFEGVNIVYEWGFSFENFTVVPIPVSKKKENLRGFNQADIISKIFAKRFNISVDNSILNRVKDKHAQHSLSREERFQNVKDAFVADRKVEGKRVVLVDDICTTGATFLEASKVLFENGALDVKCFALSKKL